MIPRSPSDLVAEMQFEISKRPSLAFLLVEGHDDAKFWKPRTRAAGWECIVALGKANVLGTVSHRSRPQAALGIVDADYDHYDAVACPDEICRTEEHDLEAMFIRSGALDRVLHELGSADKIARFEHASGSVRDHLSAMGAKLARIRRANHVAGWGLKFKKNIGLDRVPYAKFIDRKTWALDLEAMVTTVLNYNSRHDLPASMVLAEMARIVAPADPWHWLNGHDLAAILVIGLSHVLGSTHRQLADVESALRLAHDRSELEATALGRDIRGWEARAARLLLAF
jgi:Protein of unknown function (DUF4435)